MLWYEFQEEKKKGNEKWDKLKKLSDAEFMLHNHIYGQMCHQVES